MQNSLALKIKSLFFLQIYNLFYFRKKIIQTLNTFKPLFLTQVVQSFAVPPNHVRCQECRFHPPLQRRLQRRGATARTGGRGKPVLYRSQKLLASGSTGALQWRYSGPIHKYSQHLLLNLQFLGFIMHIFLFVQIFIKFTKKMVYNLR